MAQLLGVVKYDPLHTGVFCCLNVGGEVVDKDAVGGREREFAEQSLINSGLWFQQVEIGGDDLAGKALAARYIGPGVVLERV